LPKLKPEELESRRREIVDAARTCFLRAGFHKTTTDDICREASITPGGLYHYFRGKSQIITAVIELSALDIVDQIGGMTNKAEDAPAAFRAAGGFFLQLLANPEVDTQTRLDIEIWGEAIKDESVYETNRKAWAMRRGMMETILQRMYDEGMYEGQEMDVKGLASLFMATFIGMRICKLLWREDFDISGSLSSFFLAHSGRVALKLPDIPSLPVRQAV